MMPVRDWKDWCLEMFWRACVWGQGPWLVRQWTAPTNPPPPLEPVSQPGSGSQSLAHWRQRSTPHLWSRYPSSWVATWLEFPPGPSAQKTKGLFGVEHAPSTCLNPTSSWYFYQLNTTGNQELVAMCVLFWTFSVFLFLLLITPFSWNFQVT